MKVDHWRFCSISLDSDRILSLYIAFLLPRQMYFLDLSLFLTFLVFQLFLFFLINYLVSISRYTFNFLKNIFSHQNLILNFYLLCEDANILFQILMYK